MFQVLNKNIIKDFLFLGHRSLIKKNTQTACGDKHYKLEYFSVGQIKTDCHCQIFLISVPDPLYRNNSNKLKPVKETNILTQCENPKNCPLHNRESSFNK